MKISVLPHSCKKEARYLPPNTIVKFPNNAAYFVVPSGDDLPGVWLSDGTTHGAIDVWGDSRYYDDTNYTIVGMLKIEI
jgi:hypothetical protein